MYVSIYSSPHTRMARLYEIMELVEGKSVFFKYLVKQLRAYRPCEICWESITTRILLFISTHQFFWSES